MTENIFYTLLNPTGNVTLLVETPVPVKDQPSIATKLMEEEPKTEQVGFVSFSSDGVNMRMAGGEFCGNAAMSAAALYLERQKLAEGTVSVSVAGTKDPVRVILAPVPEGGWRGTVNMPKPAAVGRVSLPGEESYPAVRFSGITHLIIETAMEPKDAEALAKKLCTQLDADALGLMFLNRKQGTLSPLVVVPDAGTLCWESSCASGTTAVGAFLAAESGKKISLRLKQPKGSLEIAAQPEGDLLLTGRVFIDHSGMISL